MLIDVDTLERSSEHFRLPEPGSVAIVEKDFEALRDKCAALRMSAAQARALATALVAAAEESERLQELFCRDSGADESGASSEFL